MLSTLPATGPEPKAQQQSPVESDMSATRQLERFVDVVDESDPDRTRLQHCWLTASNMKLDTLVPAIPDQYAAAVRERRAIYVLGVPAPYYPEQFRDVFKRYGPIESCPFIIDLWTEDTFRWVIMATKEAAESLMNEMHMIPVGRTHVRTCYASEPGRDIHGNAAFNMEQLRPKKGPDVIKTTVVTMPPRDSASSGARVNAANSHATFSQNRVDQSSQSQDPAAVPQPASEGSSSSINNTLAGLTLDDTKSYAGAAASTNETAGTTKTGSWANVAGTIGGESKTINLFAGTRTKGPRLYQPSHTSSVPNSATNEPMIDQMRVVFLLDLPKTITLNDVSNAIREGPVASMRFGVNSDDNKRYIGIIFQHAKDAEAFFQVIAKERADNRPRRFKFLADAVRGEAFPANDTIEAMCSPTYASRRLTIVNKGFFFVYGEKQLKRLCEKTVGKENVELVFIYNGGNATAVFSDVVSAMQVKKALESLRESAEKGKGEACFEGLNVTFSKDQCELGEPLNLQSSFPPGSDTTN